MTIKEQLIEVMERKGLTQSQVSRAIGKSTAVVNQYLQGKYAGDVDGVNQIVADFIERIREKDKLKRIEARFVSTSTSRKALEIIRLAHVDAEINVIYGEAGLGKTMALKAYAAANSTAILIEADPSYTARVLLEEICSRLNLSTRGNMHELFELCVNKLRDSGYLLMIDEGELLPHRALEVLRRIHDKSGIGIVLAGMPRLILNLKGKRGEFVQLYSRVGFALNIGNALPQDDTDTIAESLIPDAFTPDMGAVLYKESKGNARRLFKLLRGVVRTSHINDRPVNIATVRQFAEMLIN
ncbi:MULTISPECIES: ATPase [Brenneria]|uniref:ATPase n=1 Tax=Brenneria nigrifluens DSM 30175 = ATCC 13028 TaxID=1121120 RepID=A0A2U1USQ9_9GAMM|nr:MULTISPECIES: ATPase [Brenneria]EHD21521.1 XRE family transcriptional regulator [Brenneria sp. EniD312]PWC24693.1 ATPase [Brenneria nigrifluens] [Brenneria nigrifluens DSM 30175 = ATCC 13028]QCR04642.1 ATPase [Brenneria nigrifluens] [Brenneria nigrifluens DSM 30175 = ATCC 13028]